MATLKFIGPTNNIPLPSVNELVDIMSQWSNARSDEQERHATKRFVSWERQHSKVGQGSSRGVYRLTDDLVAKVCVGGQSTKKNNFAIGKQQNSSEVRATETACIDRSMIAGVVAYSNDMSVVVSEYARPATSEDFLRFTGFNTEEFLDVVYAAEYWNKEQSEYSKRLLDTLKSNKHTMFWKKIMHGSKACAMSDLAFPDHWGVIGNKRLVVIDYGYDPETRKLYRSINEYVSAPKTNIDKLLEYLFRPTIEEKISLDIDVGDVVLGGKFKNKRIVVKTIDVDELGQPTINGKPILKVRIEKDLPADKQSKETRDSKK
jgi:hypothetical protein